MAVISPCASRWGFSVGRPWQGSSSADDLLTIFVSIVYYCEALSAGPFDIVSGFAYNIFFSSRGLHGVCSSSRGEPQNILMLQPTVATRIPQPPADMKISFELILMRLRAITALALSRRYCTPLPYGRHLPHAGSGHVRFQGIRILQVVNSPQH